MWNKPVLFWLAFTRCLFPISSGISIINQKLAWRCWCGAAVKASASRASYLTPRACQNLKKGRLEEQNKPLGKGKAPLIIRLGETKAERRGEKGLDPRWSNFTLELMRGDRSQIWKHLGSETRDVRPAPKPLPWNRAFDLS